MLSFGAIIFDFDGVLLESEFEGNRQLAELLTDLGHRTSVEEAFKHYAGLSGRQFVEAIETRIGAPLPPEFHARQKEGASRALRDGIDAVVGAVDFVQIAPAGAPESSRVIEFDTLDPHSPGHLGLTEPFGDHIYSGREHVARGKPAPDIYLYAAEPARRSDIGDCVILEDSRSGRDRRACIGSAGDRPRRRARIARRPRRRAAGARRR